jgi:cell division protein FtsI (penicillin-binding protein 3)
MKNLDPARARWIRLRMGILCGLMGLGLGGLVSSAYRVQVEDGPAWRATAEKQRQRRLHVQPKRGTITDRNGTALAVSVEVPSVSADVVEMLHGAETPEAQNALLDDASNRIATVLSMKLDEVRQKLEPKHRFVWLKRRISADEADKLRDLGDPRKTAQPIKGLAIEGEGHRYYPGRELAGAVLGFVAPDGSGKDGLELAFDDELKGHVEEVKALRDRSGRIIFAEGTDESALAGHDLELTLDEGIQHVAEQELDAAQKTYELKGGTLIVVDPNSGEILALASTPGYNPNDYGDAEPDARRDRVIADRFEPGSVMKIFTVSAALAAGTLKPMEQIYCEHGQYSIGSFTIHDTHLNDWLTPTQILAVSSNIGAAKIAMNLGEPALYSAFRRFGFGEESGLPLPGESSGVLRPRGRPWYEVETASAAYGQGIGVTTLQLVMGVSAIANGGRLLEPRLVRRVTDSRGDVVREFPPRVKREAVPAGVARMMTEMLTAVTEDKEGTGHQADVPGFHVAGKTATAQKIDPATGRMAADKFTSSFVGFLPAERPRLAIAVVLDEPMIGHLGGEIAGPVFRRVAEASMRYLGVSPSGAPMKLPSADDLATNLATGAAGATGTTGASASALAAASPNRSDASRAQALPSEAPPPAGSVRVPDATGMAVRDAIRLLTGAGFIPEVQGSGRLVRQTPAIGSAAPKGARVQLVFESPS